MPRKKRKPEHRKKGPFPIAMREWHKLTPVEKAVRKTSFHVLSLMKEGKSLWEASRLLDIDPRKALRHVRTGVVKGKHGYVAKKRDKISAGMLIKEKGINRDVEVTVSNSETRSLIGKYQSAIGEYLSKGDSTVLDEFEKVVIIDANRRKHLLETDPSRIKAIEEQKEDREFYSIYAGG